MNVRKTFPALVEFQSPSQEVTDDESHYLGCRGAAWFGFSHRAPTLRLVDSSFRLGTARMMTAKANSIASPFRAYASIGDCPNCRGCSQRTGKMHATVKPVARFADIEASVRGGVRISSRGSFHESPSREMVAPSHRKFEREKTGLSDGESGVGRIADDAHIDAPFEGRSEGAEEGLSGRRRMEISRWLGL